MATLARSIVSKQAAMEIVVLHTTVPETLQALKTAANLAHGLSAHIRLLVLEVVPYPLPLEHPQVALPFTHRRFRTLAENAAVETNVDIHLVRDREKVLSAILEPHSVVVLGAHCRLAKWIARAGHQVVYPTFSCPR